VVDVNPALVRFVYGKTRGHPQYIGSQGRAGQGWQGRAAGGQGSHVVVEEQQVIDNRLFSHVRMFVIFWQRR